VPESVADYSPPDRPDLRFTTVRSRLVQSTFWMGMDPGGRSVAGAQIALWEELCARASETLEVGAYIGTLTVPGARATSAPYRAVEANPETAAVLRRNVALNRLTHVEVVEAAAVADGTEESVELVLPPDEGFRLATGAAVDPAWRVPSAVAVRVPAVPITDLIGNADLLKLDVEGLELLLLAALEPFIATRRPKVMIEVLDYNTDLKRWLAEFAKRHAMNVLAITAHGTEALAPDELPRTSLLRRYGTRDVLVVPT